MDIIKHESNDAELPAPNDWDEATQGPCEVLPVTTSIHDGVKYMTSFWQPSAEDLARLNAGLPIMLTVQADNADAHPVVSVHV